VAEDQSCERMGKQGDGKMEGRRRRGGGD